MTASSTVADTYAGDTSKVWEVGWVTSEPGVRPAVLADLDSNYACRIAVRAWTGSAAGAEVMAARAVTAKNDANTRFRASLTPAETADLAPGEYVVGIELANATLEPPLVQQVQRRVRIWPAAVE